MAKPKLKIIACRLGEAPRVEEMEPGLASMQAFVGGYIEAVRLAGEYGGAGVDLFCDEEFLLKGYAPNRLIRNRLAIHGDFSIGMNRNDLAIHGDFFIAAHDEEGETVSLTDAQLIHWFAEAKAWPVAIF